MLIDRAKQLGFNEAASDVSETWDMTARALAIREDYEGTWGDVLFGPLRKTIDDMLEESSPVSCLALPEDAPVAIINEAWKRFERNEPCFAGWERAAIDRYLGAIG